MRNLFFVALAATLLTGCNPFEGRVEVLKPFKVDTGSSLTAIRPGNYFAKIDFTSKRKAKITIKANNDVKFKIKLPRGYSFPTRNGSFSFDSRDLKQPFDIHGDIATDVTRSGTRSSTESCTYTERRRVCRRVSMNLDLGLGADFQLAHHVPSHRPNGGGRVDRPTRPRPDRPRPRPNPRPRPPREECRWETVTRHGRQNVEYYYEYTDQQVTFDLTSADSTNLLGEFVGNRRSSDKHYTYRGSCRR